MTGKHFPGRGVVGAPEQRGEHRQRLRADLAVGLAFLLVAHQGAPGSRTERANLRVETLISIWFMARFPSQSSATRRIYRQGEHHETKAGFRYWRRYPRGSTSAGCE